MRYTRQLTVSRDFVAGLLFLVIGVAALIAVPRTVLGRPDEFGFGPRFVPQWAAILVTLLSTVLIAKSTIGMFRGTETRATLAMIVPSVEGIAILGLIALWVAGARTLGYLPSSIAVVVLGLLLFWVRSWKSYAVGVGFVTATWVVFTFFLNVRLP